MGRTRGHSCMHAIIRPKPAPADKAGAVQGVENTNGKPLFSFSKHPQDNRFTVSVTRTHRRTAGPASEETAL
ncbi:unnamed protein product [Arctogadus glacialis]